MKVISYVKNRQNRKVVLTIAVLIVAVGVFIGYRIVQGKSTNDVSYVTAKPQKGTLTVSVDGSGQVSASNQVDIKAKASGEVLSIKLKTGQEVTKGEVLAQLDTRDALKTVRDAQASLASSQLSLKKLKDPADALSVLQAENSLQQASSSLAKLKLSQKTEYDQAVEARQKAVDNLSKAYEDSLNKIADAFLDMPDIISKISTYLYGTDIGSSEAALSNDQGNADALLSSLGSDYDSRDKLKVFINSAISDYNTARGLYDKNFISYKSASRYSPSSTIEALLAQTINTVKAMTQALKSEVNLYDTWVDFWTQKQYKTFSQVTANQSGLSTYTGEINSHLSALLAIQRTLQDNKDNLLDADRDLAEMIKNNPLDLVASEQTVKEKQTSLAKLKAGTDPLDIKSQEIAVQQKANTLLDAQQKLADYAVKAPFDGIISSVTAKLGDTLSSSGAVATIISKKKLAVIPLNEVDVAKIKTGQKAVLTFDAVADLSITGEVVEVDILGTVSQGVVNYNVTIAFDAQNTSIKPGMSVSAVIIIQSKNDVLMIPAAAVKSQDNNEYVTIKKGDQTEIKDIKTGLSNGTTIEIISGLTENDEVITQTVSAGSSADSAAGAANSRNSGFGGNSAQGMFRVMR